MERARGSGLVVHVVLSRQGGQGGGRRRTIGVEVGGGRGRGERSGFGALLPRHQISDS